MDQLLLNFNSFLGAASMVDWLNMSRIALELIIIGYAIVWTWGRIKGTQAERLLKGILVISMLCLFSWVCGLTLITSLLQQLIPVAVVSLVIIFQPEIRRGLGYLGRSTFKVDFSLADSKKQRAGEVIKHVISAVRELSREKTGALIVIEPEEGERDYLSPGTTINAEVSSNLLISLFVAKSPLHDGAVIVRADKIVAAGVILPMTDSQKLNYRYGTRHRAAIGLSEIYDGLCIVVSEETGVISAANRGMLVQYRSADELAGPLSYFYFDGEAEIKAATPFQAFLSLFTQNGTADSASDNQPAQILRASVPNSSSSIGTEALQPTIISSISTANVPTAGTPNSDELLTTSCADALDVEQSQTTTAI